LVSTMEQVNYHVNQNHCVSFERVVPQAEKKFEILVFGAPKCGKTSFVKYLVNGFHIKDSDAAEDELESKYVKNLKPGLNVGSKNSTKIKADSDKNLEETDGVQTTRVEDQHQLNNDMVTQAQEEEEDEASGFEFYKTKRFYTLKITPDSKNKTTHQVDMKVIVATPEYANLVGLIMSGNHALMFVYDLSNVKETLSAEKVSEYINICQRHHRVPLLIGLKKDLLEKKPLTDEEEQMIEEANVSLSACMSQRCSVMEDASMLELKDFLDNKCKEMLKTKVRRGGCNVM